MVGAKIKTVTAKIEDNFALPPMSEFEKQITPKTKGIVIVNPNNPTGQLVEPQLLKKIIKLCCDKNILLVADECFMEFIQDWEKYTMMA